MEGKVRINDGLRNREIKPKLLEGIARKLYFYKINTEETINYTYDLKTDHFTESI